MSRCSQRLGGQALGRGGSHCWGVAADESPRLTLTLWGGGARTWQTTNMSMTDGHASLRGRRKQTKQWNAGARVGGDPQEVRKGFLEEVAFMPPQEGLGIGVGEAESFFPKVLKTHEP